VVQKALIFLVSIYFSNNCASYTPVYAEIYKRKSVRETYSLQWQIGYALLFTGDMKL
jgi:hypothetical protein